MNADQPFLDDIRENPDDDAPRLVYADWLDDHGQAERAEFIRLQVRAARDEDNLAVPAMNAQAEQLRAAHEETWLTPLRESLSDAGGDRLDRALFARGFVEEVHLAVPDDLTRAAAEFRRWPIRRVRVIGDSDKARKILGLVELSGVEKLDCNADGKLITWLGRAAHLGRLRRLIIANDFALADIGRLARSDLLRRLHHLRVDVPLYQGSGSLVRLLKGDLSGLRGLDLGSWLLGEDGMAPLAAARLDALEELSLAHNNLESGGLAALVRAPFVANLTSLNLSINQLDARAAAELAAAAVPRLARLSLGHNHLGDEGVATLARSPLLAGLRELDLGYNDLTTAAIEPLVQAPLRNLRELSLVGSRLDDRGARLLADCPSLRRLRHLIAYATEVGAKGIVALLESPHLAGLHQMQFDGRPLSDAARRRLKRRKDARLVLLK